MSGKELALFVTALALGIIESVPEAELGVLAAAFTQLGDTLATISAADGQNGQDTQNKLA